MPRRTGFTLVELLVVIAIIGVLVALLLPAVQAAREAGRRSQCMNNLRQVGVATLDFESAMHKLPPQFGWSGDNHSGAFGTVFYQILPYIEEGALYDKSYVTAADSKNYPCDFKRYAGTHDTRWTVGGEVVAGFICPSDTSQEYVLPNWGWAGSCYAGNYQVFGSGTPGVTGCCDVKNLAKWRGKGSLKLIQDGTSKTLFFVEKYANCNSAGPYPGNPTGGCMWARWDWTDYWQPTFAAFTTGPKSIFQDSPQPHNRINGPCNPLVAQTSHSGLINACLADGSGRIINSEIDANLWWALCTPAGGEQMRDY